MKILFINYEFPPLGGGAGNASYHIAREMISLGHEVTVVTAAYGQLSGEETRDRVRVIRVPSRRKRVDASNVFEMLSFVFEARRRLPSIVASWHPDFSVAFFTLPCGPLSLYLKRKFGVPFATLLRGGDVPGFKGIGLLASFMHIVLKPITIRIWKSSHVVVANSRGLAQLASTTWKGPIQVVPNGVDLQYFTSPQRNGTDNRVVRLLFVGRLSAQKGLAGFFEVLKKLDTATAWQLIIVGDGPLRRQLEETVIKDAALGSRIIFRGWLEKNELLEEYRGAQVFVFPTLDEGMPNAMLEAMACGLPVLATDVAGNEELVRHDVNGYLYDPSDVEAASKHLQTLVSRPDLRTRLARESVRTAGAFGWHATALQLLHFINTQGQSSND